jgi:hypothetical protein
VDVSVSVALPVEFEDGDEGELSESCDISIPYMPIGNNVNRAGGQQSD